MTNYNKEIEISIKKIEDSIQILENCEYFISKWIPVEYYPGDGHSVIIKNKHGWKISSMKSGRCLKGLPTGWEWNLIGGEYPTHYCELPKK